MSDLLQFTGKAFPLGATQTLTYMGDKITCADSTEWICTTSSAPFEYDPSYSITPAELLIPHSLFTGPVFGGWYANVSISIAYKAADTLYCTGNSSVTVTAVEGDATNGFIYYTTVNDGVTWTRRTYPNLKNYATAYTAGQFIGAAISSTTNAIIVGTDAVSWTGKTGVSQTTIADIVSNGSTQIVIYPQSGTVANVSVDSGATWAAATGFTAPAATASALGAGYCTYNAGAGLFIGNVGVAGQYQTSPTGAVFTLRNTIATFQPYGVFLGTACKFASSATVTVAMGTNGFFATTTDGLVWENHGLITEGGLPPLSAGTPGILALYYDGSYFVALATERIFYSSTGTSGWAEGRPAFGTINTNAVTNDRHVRFTTTGNNGIVKALVVLDPAATTPVTVSALSTGNVRQPTNAYIRIK